MKWTHWYLTTLKLAVALLLSLLIILFWLLHRNKIDEQQSTLIADVLWLEQALSFHLEGNADKLLQLANDLVVETRPSELFNVRTQYLLKNSPDLQQILWLDSSDVVRDATPTRRVPHLGTEGLGVLAQADAIEMVKRLGKATYTDVYRVGQTAQFELFQPVFAGGEYHGVLVAVYSLGGMLKQLVPWWFAEKYQVRVLDSAGGVLASSSKVANTATAMSHSMVFDPPGYGMTLQVTAHRSAVNIAQTLISALIVVLATAMLWSLWETRGHMQRRLVAEQALRAEHAYRKAMEDSLTVGMRACDLQGNITYANPAFCQMVGYSEQELINARPPMPYWPPEEVERAQAFHQQVVSGGASHEGVEVRLMRKDGGRFDALIYEAPLIDADGRHTGWMASIVDVTARKHAEELARQQQEKLQATSRLVTMGELASTLAHELNQPLAAITSYNTGCLNKLQAGDFNKQEISEALTKLGVQAQRAGRIVRRVHDFVRKSEPKLAPCNPADVIDDSIALIAPAAKLLNIRIERDVGGEYPPLVGDRVMLEQVLLNLMRNGIEAMSNGDIPAIRRRLLVTLNRVDEQMQIRVADFGPGIPSEVQEKLFTPFFSTKSDGMGMGLNICRSIIEFHRGRLWLEPNPEGGTIFAISLPVTPVTPS